MLLFNDYLGREIRFTDERMDHILGNHPEIENQAGNIEETLGNHDKVVRPITDYDAQLFYKYFDTTPVTEKYLCVVVKVLDTDAFIITTYFTNTVKKGDVLWKKK